MLRNLLSGFLIVGSLLAAPIAEAALVLSWDYAPASVTIAGAQTVDMNAVLTNESTSTEHLTGANFGASFTYSSPFLNEFEFSFGPNFSQQFAGLDLAPGSSFNFLFGVLTPIDATVVPGTYTSVAEALAVSPNAGATITVTGDSHFTLTVGSAAVPEPGILAMFLAALGALSLARRLRRNEAL